MFRIRRILDDSTEASQAAIRQAQEILRAQLPGVPQNEVAALPRMLRDPLRYRFRSMLFIAETTRERVRGFALLQHAPDLNFCFLDFLSVAPGRGGGGVGTLLYEHCREEALAVGAVAILFECPTDDPGLPLEPRIRRQNADRLRFYERFGARPIANTLYEQPIAESLDNPPFLCLDGLGRAEPLSRDRIRPIVRAITERKYAHLYTPAHIEKLIESFADDPVRLRPLRYFKPAEASPPPAVPAQRIPLIVNDQHQIHHVRERGYVQSPVRIASILGEIDKLALFERLEPQPYPEAHIRAVHDGALVDFLRAACAQVPPDKSIYPYIFPIRNPARPPKAVPLRAGYFCIDTFTPLNANAWLAARRAVDCALTAADRVLRGDRIAYALVRPPGHHAERRAFGGFCYFNNAAIAAHYLSRYGRIAVLDIDYHHGNGTQDIFYRRADVLTVSIHGHPSFAYPYFSGHRDERGEGPGLGFNINLPLPETITAEQHREALAFALHRVSRFDPTYLVLAVGFDTAAGDPTGSWPNKAADFFRLGAMIGGHGLPTLVVQEGGYRVRTLGSNAAQFFAGLSQGMSAAPARRPAYAARPAQRPRLPSADALYWRDEPREQDDDAVRALLEATGQMQPAEIDAVVERLRGAIRAPGTGNSRFVFAESAAARLAFAAFAPVPGGRERFQLHAFAVRPPLLKGDVAAALLRRVEDASLAAGGRRLYVELPLRRRTAPLVGFLEEHGFRQAATIKDYYGEGVPRLVLAKHLPRPATPARDAPNASPPALPQGAPSGGPGD